MKRAQIFRIVEVLLFLLALALGCALYYSTPNSNISGSDLNQEPQISTEEIAALHIQGYDIYVVQPGDTLSKIAEQFMGDAHRFPELGWANGKEYWLFPPPDGDWNKSVSYITPGQCIKVPALFSDKPKIRDGIFQDCSGACAISFGVGPNSWARTQKVADFSAGIFVTAKSDEQRLYFYGQHDRASSEDECK